MDCQVAQIDSAKAELLVTFPINPGLYSLAPLLNVYLAAYLTLFYPRAVLEGLPRLPVLLMVHEKTQEIGIAERKAAITIVGAKLRGVLRAVHLRIRDATEGMRITFAPAVRKDEHEARGDARSNTD